MSFVAKQLANKTSAHATHRCPYILVADVGSGISTMERILGNRVVIVGAKVMTDAVVLLKKKINLIACGIHFDESRMFDLLRLAKADAATRDIPFVCFRDIDSELSMPVLEGLQIACTALGAATFLDLHQLRCQHGTANADEEFRDGILGLIRW